MFHWTPPSHCIGSICWEPSYGGNIPPDAVLGGRDLDGGPIFVGRAMHHGDVLPAKICPNHGGAFVSYDGREECLTDFEVLKSSHFAWKPAHGGDVPSQAIKVGQTKEGEPLYVGRVLHEGTLTVGKVHPSHGVLYVSWAGEEKSFHEYEILILC